MIMIETVKANWSETKKCMPSEKELIVYDSNERTFNKNQNNIS